MTLLIICFIAGILTVFAPCILPLLPVIVGGSLSGAGGREGRVRAVTITTSLALSVIAFTILLKVSTLLLPIPEYVWKVVSGCIIIAFGFVTLFPTLWERLALLGTLNVQSNALLGAGYQKKSIAGDIIIGAALGPVFSTCSPTYFVVLATILPARPVVGIFYLLAYTLGLSIALLFVSLVGQRIMERLGLVADPHAPFRRALGLLFIVVGIGILTGLDKTLERKLLDAGLFDVTKVEQRLLQLNHQ